VSNAWIREFDDSVHGVFAAAGMADVAVYAPPDGGVTGAGERRVYVNNAQQTAGEFGQVVAPRTVVGVLLADGAVEKGGTLAIGSDETYVLQRPDETNEADRSIDWWVVRHG
jgi:hypothetical protein